MNSPKAKTQVQKEDSGINDKEFMLIQKSLFPFIHPKKNSAIITLDLYNQKQSDKAK